jgi:hypothetical protein
MDSNGTFKQMVRELSPGERKNLLQKFGQQLTLNQDPLYVDGQLPTLVAEDVYGHLPWYYHIGFLLLSFFAAKPPVKLYHEREIAKVGRVVKTQAPGLYDHSGNLLLAQFYKELLELKESARFFFRTLDAGVNRDQGAFYAFLASLEMEDIHNRLVQETDPAQITEKNPEMIPAELRRVAFRKLEDAISLMNDDQRAAMYADIRFLFCLKELASFPFDRVIKAFSLDFSTGGMGCSAVAVRESLSVLNNILFSLKKIPSMSLFESLFIFCLQDRMREPAFDAAAESEKLLAQAERSLSAIRRFNQTVPLTLIIRCAFRDLSLSPVEISGGEDWLAVYRDYEKHRIEDQFSQYLRTTRSRALQESLGAFFDGVNPEPLENVESETNPGGIPVPKAMSLAFLETYHALIFTRDNEAVLRDILFNGEFYNRDNQIDFFTCYNELNRFGETIKGFDFALSPFGEFGVQYASARKEMSSPMARRRKVHAVVAGAATEADQIIERARDAFISLVKLLNGILKKDETGQYDTLANFAKIAGKGTTFTDNLNRAVENARTALKLLDDINFLESKQ